MHARPDRLYTDFLPRGTKKCPSSVINFIAKCREGIDKRVCMVYNEEKHGATAGRIHTIFYVTDGFADHREGT